MKNVDAFVAIPNPDKAAPSKAAPSWKWSFEDGSSLEELFLEDAVPKEATQADPPLESAQEKPFRAEDSLEEPPLVDPSDRPARRKHGRKKPILSESVSCRRVENKGCVTLWQGRWDLFKISGSKEAYSAKLTFYGRRLELETVVDVSDKGTVFEIPDWKVSLFLPDLDDCSENLRLLTPYLGTNDSITVCNCLADFSHNKNWADMLSEGPAK